MVLSAPHFRPPSCNRTTRLLSRKRSCSRLERSPRQRAVPEGFVGRSKGCPTARIVFRHRVRAVHSIWQNERSFRQASLATPHRWGKTIGAVGHPSDRPTKPSCTARCLGERSSRGHERLRDRSRRSVTAGRAKMWGAKIHAWKPARCSPLKPHGPLGTPGERPRIFSGMFDT